MRKLPKYLYSQAMRALNELCEWCQKPQSIDCAKCQIDEARVVVELHKP